jgi:glycopeptide antibiotics resistance protein
MTDGSASSGRPARTPSEAPAADSPPRLLPALFVVYLVLLVWLTLWKFELPYAGAAALTARPIKLIPFIATDENGSSAPWEVLANLLLFLPFGIHLRLLAPSWRLWPTTALFAGASLAIEIAEYVLSVGSFDTTDIIVNTIGGLAGVAVAALAQRGLQGRTRLVFTRILAVATALGLLAIAVYLVSPVRHVQQKDVVVPGLTAHAP